MASPTNISLPSIHEMFPTHLMRRDKLDPEHPLSHYTQSPTLTPPSPTRTSHTSLSMSCFSPTPSNSTCTIARCHSSSASILTTSSANSMVPSTVAPPQPRAGAGQAYPPPHLHASGGSRHPHARACRAMAPAPSSSANRTPSILATSSPSPSGSVSSVTCSPVGPTSRRVRPPELLSSLACRAACPQAPCRAQALPYYERKRRYSYPPPPPSAHHQHPMGTRGHGDDDASRGGIDLSPMQMSQGVTPHLVPAHPGVLPASHAQGMLLRSGKQNICPTCFKLFNRPSSLRIHQNTHTGATPFRCPWPNCSREFNVNSNMRRHYRNHSAPSITSGRSSNPTNPSQVSSLPGMTGITSSTTRRRSGAMSSYPAIQPSLGGSLHGASKSVSMHMQGEHMQLEDGRRKRRRVEGGRGPVDLGRVDSEEGKERGPVKSYMHNPKRAYAQDQRRGPVPGVDEELERHDLYGLGSKPLVPICVSPRGSASPSQSLSPAWSAFERGSPRSSQPSLSSSWPSSSSSHSSRPSSSWSPATPPFEPLSEGADVVMTSAKKPPYTKPRYNTSTPGLADMHVSKVLRPAFQIATAEPGMQRIWAGRTVEIGSAC